MSTSDAEATRHEEIAEWLLSNEADPRHPVSEATAAAIAHALLAISARLAERTKGHQ